MSVRTYQTRKDQGRAKADSGKCREGGVAQMKDNRSEAARQKGLQLMADNRPQQRATIQAEGFGKYRPKRGIDPDLVGGGKGIRKIPEEAARPDDVPLVQDYRLAMHRLHDVILVLEKADRSGEDDPQPRTEELRRNMVATQTDAKYLAKQYKKNMRDLSSTADSDALLEAYTNGMDGLKKELLGFAKQGEVVINEYGYLTTGTLKEEGTELWRKRWLNTKKAVDTAMGALWGGWQGTLKATAKNNNGDDSPSSSWAQRIDKESWNLYYGGSLMKGYKGPPKQNTRFLASNFDVDANMDAPAVAEYLINKKGNKVDRGQLDPRNAPETKVEKMDKAMDDKVKQEMVNAGLFPSLTEAEKVISEEFETRVNAPEMLTGAAGAEVERSTKEQEVRDKLTSVRLANPDKMTSLGAKIMDIGLYDVDSHALIARVLTSEEIDAVGKIVSVG